MPEVEKPRWAWGILLVTGVGIMGEFDVERGIEVAEGVDTTVGRVRIVATGGREGTEGTDTTL